MIWRKVIPLQRAVIRKGFPVDIRNVSTSGLLRKNHYEVLGVSKEATQTEIKNAYFKLSKLYHPDRITATDENLDKFRAVTTAYEILGNEQSRRLYDTGLLPDDQMISGADLYEKDPIVSFYKEKKARQRQADMMKNEAWMQDFYTTRRKATMSKNELFREFQKEEEDLDESKNLFFILCMTAFLLLFYYKDLEGHRINILWKEYIKSNVK